MYTVGQVSKFLGVSIDTLKFYEEKGLVKPAQDKENGYRKYSILDIYNVLTVNIYREIDIEIKNIQQIKKSKNLSEIEALLNEQERKIQEEIEYKELLLKRLRYMKEVTNSYEKVIKIYKSIQKIYN